MERFDSVIQKLSTSINSVLLNLPPTIKKYTQEIRLRIDMPLCIRKGQEVIFINKDSTYATSPSENSYIITQNDIEDSFKMICNYSFHTHEHEIAKGYVTMKGGHRAGICGVAVYTGNNITTMTNISSINIRIARQIKGVSDKLFNKINFDNSYGFIIAGAPSCGKTTMLRDIARKLSSGELGKFYNITVVDERCEICSSYQGKPQNDMGKCCDVLDSYHKSDGILQAVRTLSPNIIICDELGSDEEVNAVLKGVNCGVNIITSIHAHNMDDLKHKLSYKRLVETGAFKKVVFMENKEIREIKDIF